MKFSCTKCGSCCRNRYLCIYYFETDLLNELKTKYELKFNLISFRSYFDLTNKIIIDVIYRLDVKPCPFFADSCRIQSEKFLSCQKYPINTYIDLGFLSLLGFNKLYFDIDKECTFIKTNSKFLEYLNSQKLEDIFTTEYIANLKDHKTWVEIFKKIKEIKKIQNYKILIDYKVRKKKPIEYNIFLKSWKHMNFNEYMNWISLRSE